MDFNGYYDTREFSVLTINMKANFPNRFQYFSLTNYEGQSTTSDIGNLYSEHNLRYPVSRKLPLDYTFQYVLRSGLDNDDILLGFRWRLTHTPWIGTFLKKLKTLFSAFNQADNTISRKYGGTGLGLTISNKLAIKMNSTINVSSEFGKGSVFEFIVDTEV